MKLLRIVIASTLFTSLIQAMNPADQKMQLLLSQIKVLSTASRRIDIQERERVNRASAHIEQLYLRIQRQLPFTPRPHESDPNSPFPSHPGQNKS